MSRIVCNWINADQVQLICTPIILQLKKCGVHAVICSIEPQSNGFELGQKWTQKDVLRGLGKVRLGN